MHSFAILLHHINNIYIYDIIYYQIIMNLDY
nr:MAG TPA: hypothetical protein [Caudoviricetes sp.]